MLFRNLLYATLVALPPLLAACAGGETFEPYLSSGYGDTEGRDGPHPAADIRAPRGHPVRAMADGLVYHAYSPEVAKTQSWLCGATVSVWHMEYNKFTVFCHLDKVIVDTGERVKRGQIVGYVGSTGENARGKPATLHFEVNSDGVAHPDGEYVPGNIEDPMSRIVGCFDPEAEYPTDRLVLTAPIDFDCTRLAQR